MPDRATRPVAAAGTALISTDLPSDKLPEFFDLMLKAKEQPVTSIELTPDFGVDEHEPNYGFIHDLIKQSLHPPTQTPSPAP
ncbi:MAG: LytR family transcriptional regulator [Microbacterium sp.]|nr:LytR family transcriptional regulator [Microbacterium sp.]